jgi:hypothetical protein
MAVASLIACEKRVPLCAAKYSQYPIFMQVSENATVYVMLNNLTRPAIKEEPQIKQPA